MAEKKAEVYPETGWCQELPALFLWTGPNEKFPEGRKDDTHLSEKGAIEVAKLAMKAASGINLELSKRLILHNK